jgi:hypothetical protein
MYQNNSLCSKQGHDVPAGASYPTEDILICNKGRCAENIESCTSEASTPTLGSCWVHRNALCDRRLSME